MRDCQDFAQQVWAMRAGMLRLAQSILHNPVDAEDAVSEAVLKAYQAMDRQRRPQAFKAWMMRIVATTCYDWLRREKRTVPMEDVESLRCAEPTQEVADTVLELIRRLSPNQQSALILYYYEGFRAKEIAGILNLAPATVLLHLSRGRKKLRELIEAEGGIGHDGLGV